MTSHFVEFPALGWHFDLSDTLVSLSLFGHEWSIRWYGALIALGFLLAAVYGFRRAPKLGIDRDRLFDVVLVCTVVAFVGARLYYVLFSANRDAYFQNPVSILQIWNGGLAIYGGLIGAFLSGLLMCRARKVNTLAAFDLASLGFLIGQCVGRWGNFFNQEAYGGNTTLPWGMTGDVIQTGIHASSAYDPAL
ncbi:MAG: prolipoprotein diacylglyceryl transferase, partial [Clostridia bacterium]|nr:prolipoprotein diacylglyceryl transferase [Clostridia bacterium]